MKFTPHPYQRYAVERIIQDPALGLFQDMGLGKTVETLTAVNDLWYNRWQVSRVLVVAPKKVAEATWQNEAQRWDHLQHLRIVSVLGTSKQRVKALYTPADIWVINRENIPWLVDYYQQDWPFDMVILDESSSFKNAQSKRFKKLKLVRSRISRIVELTGTPAPNGLEDLFAQVYLLDGGQRLGKTITSYREQFFTQDYAHPGQQYRTYSPQDHADSRIQDAISDICISMKAEDYLTLPEFIEDDIPVVLDPAAKKAYDKLERETLLEVDEDTITAGSAAVLNGKLLQLCGGAVYGNDGAVVNVHDCKMEAFMEIIEQLHGEHALVFYWFKHERDRLLTELKKTGLCVRSYQGPEDEDAWNAGEVDVLLAHPMSCGYGLNLQQGGHHAIWYTLPNWALEIYQQANKRLHRQGQQYPVIAHILLVQGGVDEDVLASLNAKGDTQETLMQALKARIERVHM
ncbi:DEAD/DEAH box helicase [Oscillibacter sp.]|uniref:DEAD/DEAH box helicase n=1 Tax=Oscillibacter sp. TaxID=1945593 RepID=UPI0028A16F5C|nr:DEAD/DEAH box helicase [Oscillibacter sp.]